MIIQEKRLFNTGKGIWLYNKREKAGHYKLTFGYLQLLLLLGYIEKCDSLSSCGSLIRLIRLQRTSRTTQKSLWFAFNDRLLTLGYGGAQCPENLVIGSKKSPLLWMSQAPFHQCPTEINRASWQGLTPDVVNLAAGRCLWIHQHFRVSEDQYCRKIETG